ncbi:hypothetical protein T439DRAFT_59155 [Meredithblackwellia eburnea MCA 4105]
MPVIKTTSNSTNNKRPLASIASSSNSSRTDSLPTTHGGRTIVQPVILPYNEEETSVTACAPCRKKRRGCKPSGPNPGQRWPCERCIKRKITCPGPSPDGRVRNTAHTPYSNSATSSTEGMKLTHKHPRTFPLGSGSSTSATVLLDRVNNLKVGLFGPSSDVGSQLPGASSRRLTEAQMGFALQYHLVKVHLSNKPGRLHKGLREVDPIEARFGKIGRVNDLSAVEELAIQTFCMRGSRSSQHTAVIGENPALVFSGFSQQASDSFIALGLSRQAVQRCLEDRLAELVSCVQILEPGHPISTALERLIVCYVTTPVMGAETGYRLAQNLLFKGIPILSDPRISVEERTVMLDYLQDLARSETQYALREGRATVLSLQTFQYLFPICSTPPAPMYQLSASDIDLFVRKESADVLTARHLRDAFVDPLANQMHVMTRLLCYHRQADRERTLERCWGIALSIREHISTALSRMYYASIAANACSLAASTSSQSEDDNDTPPQTPTPDPCSQASIFCPRGADFVSHVFLFLLMNHELLLGCLAMVKNSVKELDKKTRKKMMPRAEEAVEASRSAIADQCVALMGFSYNDKLKELGLSLKVVQSVLEPSIAAPEFERWCEKEPERADLLFQMAKYAAFGCSNAAVVADKLRTILERTTSRPSTPLATQPEVGLSGSNLLFGQSHSSMDIPVSFDFGVGMNIEWNLQPNDPAVWMETLLKEGGDSTPSSEGGDSRSLTQGIEDDIWNAIEWDP